MKPFDPPELDIVESCVKKIILHYKQPSENIIISVNNNFKVHMPSVNVRLGQGLVISAEGFQRPDIYLINTKNNIQEIFDSLLDSTLWNPRAKFIITNSDISENFLKILNNYFVSKVAIVTHEKNTYSTRIFDYEVVGENTPRKIEIGTCS